MAMSPPSRKATALQRLIRENFQSTSRDLVELCPACTRSLCPEKDCPHAHFQPINQSHTDPSLGDCSYLNTCHRPDLCRYVHYELEDPGPLKQIEREVEERQAKKARQGDYEPRINGVTDWLGIKAPEPAQWIECDVRNLKPAALGKFDIIMADPPWDIHQSLPYGTLSDDEMKSLPFPQLQDAGGLLFLWVTGRAMEVGRDCLSAWGYKRIDEIVWIKTSQLQKLIRTGRTGHWINHAKEHCLVAYKLPAVPEEQSRTLAWTLKGLDTNVLVSQVRETSRKPDEIYSMIERLAPTARRLEVFGRMHNTRAGWLTVGNQLEGRSRVHDPVLRARWDKAYPDDRL